jgi:hypothetical protein
MNSKYSNLSVDGINNIDTPTTQKIEGVPMYRKIALF